MFNKTWTNVWWQFVMDDGVNFSHFFEN